MPHWAETTLRATRQPRAKAANLQGAKTHESGEVDDHVVDGLLRAGQIQREHDVLGRRAAWNGTGSWEPRDSAQAQECVYACVCVCVCV